MTTSNIVPDKIVTLDLDEQVLLRMALNDRLRWLTDSLKIANDDVLVAACRRMLVKLDAIPVYSCDVAHDEANYTCPGAGIKCVCWDIAHSG